MRERKASIMAVDDGGRWRAYFVVIERKLKSLCFVCTVSGFAGLMVEEEESGDGGRLAIHVPIA